MFISSSILNNLPKLITYAKFIDYLKNNLWTAQIDIIYQELEKVLEQKLPWAEIHLLYHHPSEKYELVIPRWDLSADYTIISRITEVPQKTFPNDDFVSVAQSIASTLSVKDEQYGPAFQTVPQILSILYPDGIQPQDYPNVLTLTRILDKIQRIATNNGNDPEDPWRDIAGYAILQLSKKDKWDF